MAPFVPSALHAVRTKVVEDTPIEGYPQDQVIASLPEPPQKPYVILHMFDYVHQEDHRHVSVGDMERAMDVGGVRVCPLRMTDSYFCHVPPFDTGEHVLQPATDAPVAAAHVHHM